MKYIKYFLTLITIILMLGIFLFSAQPAEESTEMSNEIGYIVGRIFVPGFSELNEEEQYTYADSIDLYVRKTAHAAEYTALGILISVTLYLWFLECPYLVFLLSWLLTAFYAETDEIHQYFVPGRACMLTDVLIDASGALLGVLIITLIFTLRKNRTKKR